MMLFESKKVVSYVVKKIREEEANFEKQIRKVSFIQIHN